MPNTSILPGPAITWPLELRWPVWPVQSGSTFVQQGYPAQHPLIKPAIGYSEAATAWGRTTNISKNAVVLSGISSAVGGLSMCGSSGKDPAAFLGNPIFTYYNAGGGNPQTAWILHPQYAPQWDPAQLAPGWENDEAVRVGWWRTYHSWGQSGGGVPAYHTDDTTGIFLFAHGRDRPDFNDLPGGAGSSLQICGFIGGSATAPPSYRYRAYDNTGAVTETVAVPASLVPDAEQMNMFDFIIISAAPGRDATLNIRINGADFLTRTWGSAQLNAPIHWTSAPNGTANRVGFLYSSTAILGTTQEPRQYIGPLHFRAGRFAPPFFTEIRS